MNSQANQMGYTISNNNKKQEISAVSLGVVSKDGFKRMKAQ